MQRFLLESKNSKNGSPLTTYCRRPLSAVIIRNSEFGIRNWRFSFGDALPPAAGSRESQGAQSGE